MRRQRVPFVLAFLVVAGRALVRSQGRPLNEPLVADAAHVRFFARVPPDVQRQIVRLGECPLAVGAFVWLFSGVHSSVKHQSTGSRKTFSANFATERFFSGVRPSMTLHIQCSRKTLSTDVALVWPLSGVPPHVHRIVERSGETFATQHAQMGRFFDLVRSPGVDLNVRPKVVLPVELLLTVRAFEFLLRRIMNPVVPQQVFIPSEPTMAHFAEELVLLLVVLLFGVPAETNLPHESLTAEAAEELFVLILTLELTMAHQEIVTRERP